GLGPHWLGAGGRRPTTGRGLRRPVAGIRLWRQRGCRRVVPSIPSGVNMASPLQELAGVPLAAVQAFLDRIRDLTEAHPTADRAVSSLAAGWIARGLRPGDVVLLALPNGVGLLAQVFAVLAARG